MKDSKVVQHSKDLVNRYGLSPDDVARFIGIVVKQARKELLQEIEKCSTIKDVNKVIKKEMQ